MRNGSEKENSNLLQIGTRTEKSNLRFRIPASWSENLLATRLQMI